jgi:Tol biopolymer transport system component
MNRKTALILITALLLAGLFTIWLLAPRIEDFEPVDSPLHGQQPLSISFSRPMNPESMELNFNIDPLFPGELNWNEALNKFTFIPHKSWPSGESITVQLNSKARSRSKLPVLGNKSWTITVGSPHLAYLWPADRESNLYLVNPETGEYQTLTTEETGILDYTVTPDGMSILYSVLNENGESFIISLDRLRGTTVPTFECSAGLCRSPQISPDGSLLAYTFISREPGVQPGIRIYDLEKNTHTVLGDPEDYLDNHLWSPSSWLSYYNHTRQSYVFWNPITTQELTLPNETGGDGSWSADGRYFVCTEIIFISETLAPRHLLQYDLTEETVVDLSQGNFLEDLNPSFSPQGLILAYSRKSLDPEKWSPGRQLWVMDIEGGQISPLTAAVDYHHTSFVWHPDGNQLAYVRYNQAKLSDPPEIWLINQNGTNNLRLIINGFAPTWIP